MLELYPRGATNDQIIWRLQAAGIRLDASELLSALTTLSKSGQVNVDAGGRWRLSEFTIGKGQALPSVAPKVVAGGGAALYAARARCAPSQSGQVDLKQADANGSIGWSSIMSYYAATQRRDPRGQIEEFPDRHGVGWNLFSVSGHWWSEAEIRFAASDLPDAFRQTLSSRKVPTAAIGWPIFVSQSSSGTSFLPALILPIEWCFENDDVVVRPDSVSPSFNPAWLRETLRRTTWTESHLLDRLMPEGEDDDLASVGERMRHALATLGGDVLRPGDLAAEVPTDRIGLRNTAGFFLPDDGTFTKGTADDLETLRLWSPAHRAGTALSALIDGDVAAEGEFGIPVLSPLPLTPSQHAAARAALSGQVTVIQGPPGTGKSQIIVALIVSAIMSGRSVLLAAKNHQAVDEVERRLKQLASDAPVLVRGRDADGTRNTNFVAALAEIASAEAVSETSRSEIEGTRKTLVEVGSAIEAQFQASAQEARRNLLLSELVDRREALVRHLDTYQPKQGASFFGWIISFLKRKIQKAAHIYEALPEDMSLADIDHRIAALLNEQPLGEQLPEASMDLFEEQTKNVAAFLPKLAAWMTQPDQAAWLGLAQRVKEIEFQKIKSS